MKASRTDAERRHRRSHAGAWERENIRDNVKSIDEFIKFNLLIGNSLTIRTL